MSEIPGDISKQISMDPATLRTELELGFYRRIAEVGIREANGKADFAENQAKQEHFKAAVWALEWEMKKVSLEAQQDALQRSKQLKRPCMTLGINVRSEDRGDRTVFVAQWSALIAEGDSPEEACANFERLWIGGNYEL